MVLSPNQIKFLKGLGHALQPAVMLGKEGLTEAVLKELKVTLECHELVKVKIPGVEKEEFEEKTQQLQRQTRAVLVQVIGRTALYYLPAKTSAEKPRKKPPLKLPTAKKPAKSMVA